MTPSPRLKINVNIGRAPGETYRDSQWSFHSLKFRFSGNKHDIITGVLSIGTIILLAVSAFLFRPSNDTFSEPKKSPSNTIGISRHEIDDNVCYIYYQSISCVKK